MGFGNYGICDLWDFGIMGEGGRRGAKQREKGRARALVHQPLPGSIVGLGGTGFRLDRS